MHWTVLLPITPAGCLRSTMGSRAVCANSPWMDIPNPGEITPPRYSPLAETTSKLMVVPISTTTAGPPVQVEGRNGVHHAVRAHFHGIVVLHFDTDIGIRSDKQRPAAEVTLSHSGQCLIQLRHDARDYDSVDVVRLR